MIHSTDRAICVKRQLLHTVQLVVAACPCGELLSIVLQAYA